MTLYVLAAIAVLVVFIFLVGWDKVWTATSGPADLGAVDFATLKKGPRPNQYLVCNDDICAVAGKDIDQVSPEYRLPASELIAKIEHFISQEELIERVDDRSDELKRRYVQRTKKLKFPDTMRIEVFPLTENTSTLAVYSASQVGRSDFGVNGARVRRLLKALSADAI